MTERLKIDFENRTIIGKKVSRLRRAGVLPATVYGKGVGPFAVQVSAREFATLYRNAGRTTLINVSLPGQPPISAFVHLIQRHPVTREILHADLRAVDLLIELNVEVPVHVIGESPLVVRGDAVLNVALTTVSVRALPTAIPSFVEVDVTSLDHLDKNLYVSDIKVPEHTTILNAADELVVSITPAQVEEEPVVEEPLSTQPELIREKRDEDAAGE